MNDKLRARALAGPAGLLLVGLLAGGCSPLRLLEPKQQLLSRIELKGVQQADAERIQALYRQKPNSRFPLPKLAIYQLGRTFYNPDKLQRKLDDTRAHYNERIVAARLDSAQVGKLLTKRERETRRLQLALDKGNAIMRLGEPPVVYDSALTRQTAEQIATFLKSKGFFRSHVQYNDTLADRRFSLGRLLGGSDSLHRRRVVVTYRLTENAPFHYSQLDYDIADTAVARRVLAAQPASLLRVGDQYDEERIGQERARFEALLKNDGYFDFRQQYVTLEADTSFVPATVRLRTLIASPESGQHPRYTIRQVRFITDAGTVRFGQKRDTIRQDSTYFLAFDHRISTRLLNRKVAVHPGDYYNLTSTQTTQRQISQLDVFRFTNVNYVKVRPTAGTDSTRRQLDAVIAASPAKRYQETVEFGGTYVANLPGPFSNLRLKARNPFGGAEVLELGLRAGFEGQFRPVGTNTPDGSTPSVLTTQLGANLNLVLPQFLVPFRTNQFLTRYNPRTRISVGYNYVSRPEYTRTNLEATYDYIWQRSAYHQLVFTPIDLSLVNTSRLDDSFFVDLKRQFPNPEAAEFIFSRQFVPSISFTSLYNSNDFNQTRDAQYFRLFGEVGGLTRPLYEQTLQRQGIRVTDFYRLSADYRRYHKLSARTFFVYRLNSGLVQPLRSGSNVLPYDKYFFAGGATSLRAWKPRRLGPGTFTSYVLEADGVTPKRDENGQQIRNYNVEQPGELLLEGSVEYRFPMFSFINGAVFTDFGNVWALQSDNRAGAQFSASRFYREFAVSSGFGLRFDFTFLILRLDIATKVYDPTAPGSKWAIRNAGLFSSQDQTAFNLGIGYPF